VSRTTVPCGPADRPGPIDWQTGPMTDYRPLGRPLFCSPTTEGAEPADGRRPAPVEQGAHFLAPPADEAEILPRQVRRSFAAEGLTFSAPDQP